MPRSRRILSACRSTSQVLHSMTTNLRTCHSANNVATARILSITPHSNLNSIQHPRLHSECKVQWSPESMVRSHTASQEFATNSSSLAHGTNSVPFHGHCRTGHQPDTQRHAGRHSYCSLSLIVKEKPTRQVLFCMWLKDLTEQTVLTMFCHMQRNSKRSNKLVQIE